MNDDNKPAEDVAKKVLGGAVRFIRGLVEQAKQGAAEDDRPPGGGGPSRGYEPPPFPEAEFPGQTSDVARVKDSFVRDTVRMSKELDAYGKNSHVVMEIERVETVIPAESVGNLGSLVNMTFDARTRLAKIWLQEIIGREPRFNLEAFNRWYVYLEDAKSQGGLAQVGDLQQEDDDDYRSIESETLHLLQRARQTKQPQTRLFTSVDVRESPTHPNTSPDAASGSTLAMHYRAFSAGDGSVIAEGTLDRFPAEIGREAGNMNLQDRMKISDVHLILSVDAGRLMVSHVGRSNPTFLQSPGGKVQELARYEAVPVPMSGKLMLATQEADRDAAYLLFSINDTPLPKAFSGPRRETHLNLPGGAASPEQAVPASSTPVPSPAPTSAPTPVPTPAPTSAPMNEAPSPQPDSEPLTQPSVVHIGTRPLAAQTDITMNQAKRETGAAETDFKQALVVAVRYADGAVERFPINEWPFIVGREPDQQNPSRGARVRESSSNTSRRHLSIDSVQDGNATITSIWGEERLCVINGRVETTQFTLPVVQHDAADGWVVLGDYDLGPTSSAVRVEFRNPSREG